MKKYIFPILMACLAWTVSNAQPMTVSTPEAMQRAAEEAEQTNNPYTAFDFYDKVYDETKDKAIAAKLAKLSYELRDYQDAEKRFSRLVLKDRKREYSELRFWYAMCLKFNEKYADAIEQYNIYAADGQDPKLVERCKVEVAGCETARKAKQPDNLLINNLGKTVNSPQTETSPSYSNGELYFVSLKSKEVITLDGKEGDWYPKIYTTTKNAEEYADPAPLGTQINREDWVQGNVSITPDGKTMYFTRVEMQNNGVQTSKIFYAKKGDDGWGAANELTGVNGEYVAKHPCEGELFGEKVLFFVANIPGGKGGDDIYYAPRKSEGMFALPVNLGDVINTAGDEVTPFYKDGKLFFSSNGRATIGGLDVFESQWNGSVWSEPKMLAKGVNSSVDDFFYSQGQDGMSGFLVSNRPGVNSLKSKTCCDDIYSWEIERIKVILQAKTFRFKKKGEKENQPLENCTVSITDVSEKDPRKVEDKTNAKLNDFEFSLLPDKQYQLIASREGYQSDTLVFNTNGVKKTTTVEKKLTLRTKKKPKEEPEEEVVIVKINEPIRLNQIYYDFDDDKILPDAEKDLQYLVDLMNKYPEMKIELSSHTDAQGKDDYNEKLSQRRADSARRWMLEKGIAAERIVPMGYGERVILNGCTNGVKCDDEQHRFNRRTEFKIIAGPTEITIEKQETRVVPKDEKKPDDTKNKPKTGGKQSKTDWDFFFEELSNLTEGSRPDTTEPDPSEFFLPPVDTIYPAAEPIRYEVETAAPQPETQSQPIEIQRLEPPVFRTEKEVEAPKPLEEIAAEAAEPPSSPTSHWVNPADVSMQFNREVFNFGVLKNGQTTTTKFTLTNTGAAPLEIETVSACFCISLDYTRDPVMPGQRSIIEATFDSNDQVGNVKKDIDVIFKNTDKDGYPLIKRLTIKGKVVAK